MRSSCIESLISMDLDEKKPWPRLSYLCEITVSISRRSLSWSARVWTQAVAMATSALVCWHHPLYLAVYWSRWIKLTPISLVYCCSIYLFFCRETDTIESHILTLVALLRSCLSFKLDTNSSPHAKIVSDVLSCVFQVSSSLPPFHW